MSGSVAELQSQIPVCPEIGLKPRGLAAKRMCICWHFVDYAFEKKVSSQQTRRES